ncbi:ABC-2 transporter permease [Desnuesiella massiliensis]|uniref:ABC-2 transporter permease n=1 Tax=Desnuesiella massiliensis TaxID=1650662 RepID=UPI0006E3C7F6|nr:ABC-2 transporter permease [Desnuesiella massiliensis]
MFNLVLKDFKLIKKVLILGGAYAILLAVIQNLNEEVGFFSQGFSGFYTIFMTYVSFTYSNGYDDKNKAYMFINSLPVGKSIVVISKYLSIVCYSIFYYMFFSLCCFIVNLFTSSPLKAFDFLIMIIILLINLLIFGIQYPLYYKYGTKFLHMFKLVGFFIIFLIPNIITKLAKTIDQNTFLNTLQWINNNAMLSMLVFGIIVILITFAALNASIKIYSNKDFA